MEDHDDPVGAISRRKLDHLELAAGEGSQSGRSAGWEDVHLVPRALGELSPDAVEVQAVLMGRTFAAPLLIVGMTGGHPDAEAVNAVVGEVAQELDLPVGVGSQRAALMAPELAPTFAAVRRHAPDAFVLANIGAVQLVAQGDSAAMGIDDVRRAVDMVRADAVAVHLNAVQELLQPEGDRVLGPLLPAIAALVEASPVPVLVKETGAGFDQDSAAALVGVGVAAIDVGGVGGTSFARIEASRSGVRTPFADWGITTASSVLECRGPCAAVGVPVVATGGVRTGLDVAKALALGASFAGIGRPALLAALEGAAATLTAVERMIDELRTAMVLCGAATPVALAERPPVLTGSTRDWASQRGLTPTR